MRTRPGDETDGPTVVAIFDEAVAWLVERGQTGQWGATPFSERPGIRERVHGFRIGGGLQIAERDGEPVGVLVVGPAPAYAPPASIPELYIILLLSSRRLAGLHDAVVGRCPITTRLLGTLFALQGDLAIRAFFGYNGSRWRTTLRIFKHAERLVIERCAADAGYLRWWRR